MTHVFTQIQNDELSCGKAATRKVYDDKQHEKLRNCGKANIIVERITKENGSLNLIL